MAFIDRIMHLQFPLPYNCFMTVSFRVFSTLDSCRECIMAFCCDLNPAITSVAKTQTKTFSMATSMPVLDVNTWLGEHKKHDQGKMNSNNFRLLLLCTEFNNSLTATPFFNRRKFTKLLVYTREPDIDYIITRKWHSGCCTVRVMQSVGRNMIVRD